MVFENMKKGQVSDIGLMIAITIGSIMAFLLFFIIFQNINSAMVSSGHNTSVYDYNVEKYTQALTLFDKLIPFSLVISILAVGVSTLFIKTHPAFFIISVIMSIFVILVVAIFSNFFQEFISSISAYLNISTSFPWIYWLSNNMITLSLVGIFAFFILAYARMRGQTL